jgi:hypothetical protein
MKKVTAIASLVVAASAMTASAEVLLTVDLTVADQITILATGGLSAETIVGSDGIGVYFADFYGIAGSGLTETLVSGDITNAENASDGTPNIFRGSSDAGLNLWSWSTDNDVSFTAGSLAFVGSATWTLSATEYADMLAGNTSGDLYFPADTADDVAGATMLGQYNVIVPAPSSIALLGLGGMACIRRRR